MAKKIFIPKEIIPSVEKEVFRYDYMASIKRQMPCNEYGFYHSTGRTISMQSDILKSTQLIQGWDLGNGNIISKERKVIECSEFYSTDTNRFYVSYTYSLTRENSSNEEIYEVYLYCIEFDKQNKLLYEDARFNIFDYFKPDKIFSTGKNGHLHFEDTGYNIVLKWTNLSDKKTNSKRAYSYNINNKKISYIELSDEKYERKIKSRKLQASDKVKYFCHPDRTDLYIAVVSPDNTNFENKKYPAIVMCLGGPNINIPDFEYADSIYRRFSKSDFYVIIPLRRGVIGITRRWEDAIIDNYGREDIKDIMSGTEYVLSILSDKIDEDRVGLYGASYGGYSALLIAGKSRLFNAIVSHCGMSDLGSYPRECHGNDSDVMITYAGTDNLDKYNICAREISPFSYINQWSAPVLLVHSIDDSSVFFGQSVKTYNEGVRLKKDIHLILVPGPHTYNISNGDKLIEHIVDFYISKLNITK